jgi:hypothetical protein
MQTAGRQGRRSTISARLPFSAWASPQALKFFRKGDRDKLSPVWAIAATRKFYDRSMPIGRA